MKFFPFSTLSLLAIGVLASLPVLAQPGTGGPTPGPGAAPTETPLDGGASLLLASGIAFGAKQLRARRLARRLAK